MTELVAWGALLGLAAAMFVAVPLWRARPALSATQAAAGVFVVIAVLVGAAVLYARWGHGSWRIAATGSGGAAGDAGIATLLAATDARPDDINAWLELGRGYLRIQQWPLARRSFEHADRLGQGRNAQALGGIAETIFFQNGGELTPDAVAMFERALQLDPKAPAALFYTGVAALNAGHLDVARARFVALRELGPPPQVTAALDKQIAAIDAELAPATPDPATVVHLHVSVAAALASQVPAAATLFVFARAPEGGPPLAARRLPSTLPVDVDLSAHDSMIAGRTLAHGQHVTMMARLSTGASPMGQPGDLTGTIVAVAGSAHRYELVIDQRSK
jgi:cytochrome c-type biogenesis protein CcmH